MSTHRFVDPRGRGFILLLGALMSQVALSIDVLLPALPAVGRDLAMSPASVQLTVGLFLAGFALGQVAWGWLSDWVGRRKIILVGTGGYTLATLMCAVAGSGPELIFWRLIMGVFASASMAASRAMLRDHFTGLRLARKTAAITAVYFFSPILGPQLGTVLMLTGGWRSVFLVPGILGVLTLVVSWRYLAESHVEENRRRASLRSIWVIVTDILRHPLSGLCLAIQASMSFGLLTWVSSSPLILTEHFLVPVKYFGLFFAATAIVQLLGATLCNRLLKHYGPSFVMALGAWCSLVGGGLVFLMAVLVDGSLWWTMTGVWIFMLGFGLVVPSSGGMAMHAFGAAGGIAAAVLGRTQSLVGSLGSVTSAALYDGTPGSLGIGIGMSALATTVLALALSRRLLRRPELLADPK